MKFSCRERNEIVLAANLSVFPEQIDTFIQHLDVNQMDISNLNRYQTLRLKPSLTSAEVDEMATLFSALREKIFLAEDFNKLQDSITNLETFFKYQTETYVSNLFAQYDERVDTVESNYNTLNREFQTKIAQTDSWADELRASLYDSQYFNFDNLSYRSGFVRKTEKTDANVTVETIYSTIDESVFATRTTTKQADGTYMIVTICDKVEPTINFTVEAKKVDGTWYETIWDVATAKLGKAILGTMILGR